MIRAATSADIPALLDMGARFSERAALASNVGYDPDSMATTFERMIAGNEPVFMTDTAAIGAVVFQHPFNFSHTAAQELFWWSDGREGISLLKRLTEHCEAFCDSLTMITLEAVRPEATGRLYERMGFTPLEHSYTKVF